MEPLPATLPGVLDAAVERDGAHPLLRCGGRDVTVGELQAGSRSFAGALRRWGVEPGDRVAIMMPNVPEFVAVWFGVTRAACIEVPVHSAQRGPLLQHILGQSGARVLVCDAGFVDRLAALDLPGLERIVVHGTPGAPPPAGVAVESLAEALSGPAPGAERAIGGDTVSCILYTSGTTGPSKGVVLTHGANLRLATANLALMEYTAEDVLYTAFPLFHVNAKFTSVTSAMIAGARLVLDDVFSASRFWDRMREEHVTAFNYMGGLLSIIAKQPERPDDRDHAVSRAYGGACPPQLWEPFERRFGVRLHEHYGMTEIGIATQNTRTVRRAGSIGRAAPYFEVRLADADDRAVGPGDGRRDPDPAERAEHHAAGVLAASRRDERGVPQPLVPHRRPRADGRRRLLLLRRPPLGLDPAPRRERVLVRAGGRRDRGRRRRGVRRLRRPVGARRGRGDGGGRRRARPPDRSRRR